MRERLRIDSKEATVDRYKVHFDALGDPKTPRELIYAHFEAAGKIDFFLL